MTSHVLGGLARARSTKQSANAGHLLPMHSWALTETWRQARSLTPGTSSSRSPDSVVSAHSRSRTTSCAEPRPPATGRPRPTREQPLLVVGEAALELVRAQVVAPALDQPVGGPAPEDRRDRRGQPGHVAVDDLGLQRERRGGHDGRLAGRLRRGRRRGSGRPGTCRCRCRPARAGARRPRSRPRPPGPSSTWPGRSTPPTPWTAACRSASRSGAMGPRLSPRARDRRRRNHRRHERRRTGHRDAAIREGAPPSRRCPSSIGSQTAKASRSPTRCRSTLASTRVPCSVCSLESTSASWCSRLTRSPRS